MAKYPLARGEKIIAPARSWGYFLYGLRIVTSLLLFCVTVAEFSFFLKSQRFVPSEPAVIDYQFVIFTSQSNPTIITKERTSTSLQIAAEGSRYHLVEDFVFKNLLSNDTVRYIKGFVTLEMNQIVKIKDELEYFVDLDGTGFNQCKIYQTLSGKGVQAGISRPAPTFYGVDQSVYNSTPYASESCFSVESMPFSYSASATDDVSLTFEYEIVPGQAIYTNFLVFLLASAGVAFAFALAFGWFVIFGWLLRQMVIMEREVLTGNRGFGSAFPVENTESAGSFMKKND